MVVATLGGLIEHLEILRVLVASSGLDAEVNGLVVHDPADGARIEPGDVVLGVGIDAARSHAVELVHAAGAAGAVAVVVKLRAGPPPVDLLAADLLAAAESTGIALLGVSQDAAWGQLYTLLRTAIASLGVGGGPGPAGAPVGDLFTLANAVAAMVGGPTTIENPQSTVLAYSSLDEPIDGPRQQTILGRRVPQPWLHRLRDDGVFQRLWGGDEVVRIAYTEPGFRTRLAVAVRAGGHILGSIWVAEGRTPFGPQAETALREAARIAALHLVSHMANDDLERGQRSELFRSVLEGRRPPELLAGPLHLAAESHATVIGFQLGATGAADLAVQSARLVSLINLYADAYRHGTVCARIGPVVYALFTDLATPDQAALRRLATAVVERGRGSFGAQVHAGIGASVAGVAEVLASRYEVDLVLRAIGALGGARTVATLDDVHPRVTISRLRDLAAAEPRLLAGKLRVLADLDAGGPLPYVATLRAYLDAFGDISAAAAAMNVHPNTYRYRLRRLTELASLDLDDPLERLVIHLQLHILPEDPAPPG